jgi:membrane protein DedA with SNARE-associated domain
MDLAFEWITHYGYFAIFFLLLLGIVGLPVPDEAVLTFVGYLTFKGDLRLGPSLLAAFLGSACGITVSYGLGRLFGLQVLTRVGPLLHVAPEHILQAQGWVRRWGRFVLPLAYFLPGVRHVAALIAGASQLTMSGFAAFAYSGALLWSATFIGIGFGFGEEWSRSSPAVHRTVVVIALSVGLGIAMILGILWHRKRH